MDHSITPHQLRNTTFTKTRNQRGYSIPEVDNFFHEAADRLEAGLPAMGRNDNPRFSATWMIEGYDEWEVDMLIDMLYPSSQPPHDPHFTVSPDAQANPALTARQILDKSFSKTRLRPGYVLDEVDEFLDNVARRVSAGQPPLSPEDLPLRFNVTRLDEGYDEEEVDAFLDILYEASGIAPPEL